MRIGFGKSLRQQVTKYLAKGFSCRGLFRHINRGPQEVIPGLGQCRDVIKAQAFSVYPLCQGARLSLKFAR